MSSAFQIEFSLTELFQSRLKKLTRVFSQSAGHPVSVNEVVGMCLRALPDITPELIDAYHAAENKDVAVEIYQKTTNLDPRERQLLDEIKLALLIKGKRDFSRRDIVLGILYTASGLKNSDISYMYSEYH